MFKHICGRVVIVIVVFNSVLSKHLTSDVLFAIKDIVSSGSFVDSQQTEPTSRQVLEQHSLTVNTLS